MSRRNRRILRIAAPLAGAILALLTAAPDRVAAQESSQEWLQRCQQRDRGDGDRVAHCEVREVTLAAPGRLEVSARPNGGVSVTGADRSDVRVVARVQAWGESAADAREIASRVRVETGGGRVASTGPSTRGERSWSVSYVVTTPRRIDLELGTTNGGLSVDGVEGDLSLATTNGGISLERVGGTVRAHTTNGGVNVRLAGERWTGEGLELRTTNGGINLTVPASFGARLSANTVHGGIHTDFPVTVQGRIGRSLDAQIGGGGPPVRLTTTNGGINIRRD